MELNIKIGDIKGYIGIMGKYKDNDFEGFNIENVESDAEICINCDEILSYNKGEEIAKTILLDQALTIFGYGVDYDSFTHEERREYISLRENLMKAIDGKFMFSEEE